MLQPDFYTTTPPQTTKNQNLIFWTIRHQPEARIISFQDFTCEIPSETIQLIDSCFVPVSKEFEQSQTGPPNVNNLLSVKR